MADHQHRMDQDGTRWKAALMYGRHVGRFWTNDTNRAVIDEIAPAQDETLLDIGAGMGAGVFPAASAVGSAGRVIAVEPTPFMRRVLQGRRLASRYRGRVEVLDAVGENLPLPADVVDAAWAVNVLHHVSDLDAFAAELARVLRPGGRVLLVDEDFDDPSHTDHEDMQRRHGHHHGGDHHHDHDDEGHHHLMVDIEAVAGTMRTHGFEADGRSDHLSGEPVKRLDATLSG